MSPCVSLHGYEPNKVAMHKFADGYPVAEDGERTDRTLYAHRAFYVHRVYATRIIIVEEHEDQRKESAIQHRRRHLSCERPILPGVKHTLTSACCLGPSSAYWRYAVVLTARRDQECVACHSVFSATLLPWLALAWHFSVSLLP